MENLTNNFVSEVFLVTVFVAVILPSMAYAASAQSHYASNSQVNKSVVTELTGLVVANGGNSTTVRSIVKGNRLDGLNLNSRVRKLYKVYDEPNVLATLLIVYNINSKYTLNQAFTQLYEDTDTLSWPTNATVVTQLTELVIANNGSSTTVESIVNGTRLDGLTLNSTVGQLYTVNDTPPALASLMSEYNINSNYTLRQGFLELYYDTYQQTQCTAYGAHLNCTFEGA